MDQEHYIPSIFDYCDRRCESCPFTMRCELYVQDSKTPDKSDDPESPAFWEALRQNFQDALDQLNDILNRIGHTEEELGELPELPDAEQARAEKPDEQHAFLLCQTYNKGVGNFFTNNDAYFDAKSQAATQRLDMGLPIDIEALTFVREAIDMVRWYQHFIGIKLIRAIQGWEYMDDDPLRSPLQSDANGSAKIAMIAIQRSLDAWKEVANHFPEKQEEIQELCNTLENIRTLTLRYFPDWTLFHRPGFDDEPGHIMRLDFNPN